MTQNENRTDHPNHSKWADDGDQQAEGLEIGRPSSERTRAVNEVGSAIAHQLTGPLTALRLYVGEIRQSCNRFRKTAEMQDDMQRIVEGAFHETERLCAMMRLIADSFEEPLYPETAAALGRDVIGWWSRNSSMEEGGHLQGRGPAGAAAVSPSILALLTPREREALGHVSQGCSNKQGAVRMQIGPRTFESHRARLMRKLGARNAADLVRMALSESPVTL
jgi:DNA-binding CsgD family transcriptional regulator